MMQCFLRQLAKFSPLRHSTRTVLTLVSLLATACHQHSLTYADLAQDAANGNSTSQFLCGIYALNGVDVPQNTALAFRWFQAAAAMEHPEATGALGVCYMVGLGTPQSTSLGQRYLEKAAAMHHIPSCLTLAQLAAKAGKPRETLRWLRHAAEAGDRATQDYLARLYLSGQEMYMTPREALDYLRYAAMNGNAEACLALSQCHLLGIGTPHNEVLAQGWLEQAAQEGSREAKARLQERHDP